jgi:hypothetical protein
MLPVELPLVPEPLLVPPVVEALPPVVPLVLVPVPVVEPEVDPLVVELLQAASVAAAKTVRMARETRMGSSGLFGGSLPSKTENPGGRKKPAAFESRPAPGVRG